jgi:hypothetical protein
MKPLLFTLPILLLSACVSFGGFERLEPGAPREQVLRTMEGCPSSTQKAGRYEAFVFSDRMPRFFQWAPGTYTFILRDGVLVEFGEGTPRQEGPAEEPRLVLVPPAQVAAR